ncbi:MAG: hypothetical protein Q4B60_06535 [Erysipelotrichaceae bacterium]|nr:hypothetical protein [Erysipelotrichaceae bacterium]
MPKQLQYILENEIKIYTTKDLISYGFSRYAIEQMVKDGILKKLSSSAYENNNYIGKENDFYYVLPFVSNGVICLLSAAVYHGLSNYWPKEIDVAVIKDKKINSLPSCPNINIFHFGKDRYETGIQQINENGNKYLIYDVEKTVVDILYFRNRIGVEETKEILLNYLNRKDRNINKLYRYAEKMHCVKILKTYLEVLI